MRGQGVPVFLLAVDQELVKQEEVPFLYVPRRDLQQHAVHEHLRARVRDVGALAGGDGDGDREEEPQEKA